MDEGGVGGLGETGKWSEVSSCMECHASNSSDPLTRGKQNSFKFLSPAGRVCGARGTFSSRSRRAGHQGTDLRREDVRTQILKGQGTALRHCCAPGSGHPAGGFLRFFFLLLPFLGN